VVTRRSRTPDGADRASEPHPDADADADADDLAWVS